MLIPSMLILVLFLELALRSIHIQALISNHTFRPKASPSPPLTSCLAFRLVPVAITPTQTVSSGFVMRLISSLVLTSRECSRQTTSSWTECLRRVMCMPLICLLKHWEVGVALMPYAHTPVHINTTQQTVYTTMLTVIARGFLFRRGQIAPDLKCV